MKRLLTMALAGMVLASSASADPMDDLDPNNAKDRLTFMVLVCEGQESKRAVSNKYYKAFLDSIVSYVMEESDERVDYPEAVKEANQALRFQCLAVNWIAHGE